MTSDNPKFIDENGNVWQRDGEVWQQDSRWILVDTSRDRRLSHEMWHPGRGETKRGERTPQGTLRLFENGPPEDGA